VVNKKLCGSKLIFQILENMGLSGGLPLNPFDKHHFPRKNGHELAGIPVITTFSKTSKFYPTRIFDTSILVA
jgi:hypothetical protein